MVRPVRYGMQLGAIDNTLPYVQSHTDADATADGDTNTDANAKAIAGLSSIPLLNFITLTTILVLSKILQMIKQQHFNNMRWNSLHEWSKKNTRDIEQTILITLCKG